MSDRERQLDTWIVGALALTVAACGAAGTGDGLSGSVEVDGSSTVYPITEAVAEEFLSGPGRRVRVTVGVSGTGGGFKRFCTGETAISNASRPIAELERELCAENGVDFLELPIAMDGIAVAVNKENTFAQCMTVEELRSIWEPGSTVRRWSDVRAGWPDQVIRLYGPGADSGTFDYFTEAIVGEARASRPDFTASEDDNVLVQGIAGDPGALGYFGLAYYEENADRLGVVAVDGGQGCVVPSGEAIHQGRYVPLSRPVFIYVNTAHLARPEVEAFVRFYVQNSSVLAEEVGYVGLDEATRREALSRLERALQTVSATSAAEVDDAPGVSATARGPVEIVAGAGVGARDDV